MSNDYEVTPFARGVKLTRQHATTALTEVTADLVNVQVEFTKERLGVSQVLFEIPWSGGGMVESHGIVAFLPWTMPPFQQQFDRATLTPPFYRVHLNEVSLSFDQRAEPAAIAQVEAINQDGKLTAADMTRYNMVLRLFERKTPSLTTAFADTISADELLRIDISGVEAFGTGADGQSVDRLNPIVVTDLDVPINPFAVYFWRLDCPGLFIATAIPPLATTNLLALPSLALACIFVSPLHVHDQVSDFSAPGIQNMPTVHNGVPTGLTVPVLTPAANAVITGTDIQDLQHGFDVALRQRLASGYGGDFGALGNPMQAADVPPRSALRLDAHYSMIVVPMWGGQFRGSLQAQDVPNAGLPYLTGAPWQLPTMDRRMVHVPEGFVLHHAFAVWNGYSPPAPNSFAVAPARTAAGQWPTSITYENVVGIGLVAGMKADQMNTQEVARVVWTPVGGANPFTNFLVDSFDFRDPAAGILTPCYRILQIPLVSGALWNGNSWYQSGRPFFMGKSNTRTTARTNVGSAPFIYGGATVAPVTAGREAILEIRWSKQDAVVANGLSNPGQPRAVIVGQGGEWVILVGRQSVVG